MQLPAIMLMPLVTFAADFPPPDQLAIEPGFPDPLRMRDGAVVSTREQWMERRVPELRALFEHYMYGRWPAGGGWRGQTLLFEDAQAIGGAATVREFAVDVGLEQTVQLLVVTPNAVPAPVPCFLGLNFHGNHALLEHAQIALPKGWVRGNRDGSGGHAAREEDRGKERDAWNVAGVIERGYAIASFYQGDIVADEAKLAKAALAKLNGPGNAPRPDDTATLMAWAWGFSQMLTALEKIEPIDSRRVAAVGHSRNGKTALLAAGFDTRFAMVIPSQAGSGGTGPSRVAPELAAPQANGRPRAETVAVITKAFPHWFAANFSRFAEEPGRLPFDQHSLVALCAPRPVLLSNATEDLWANPAGQFEMLRGADPVYQLVAGDGLGAAGMPPVGKLLDSRLGYFLRAGNHSMEKADWDTWLDYADRWLKSEL
jgi:hypothetical protein